MNKKIAYTQKELEMLDMGVVITRGLLWAYGIIKLEELYGMVKKYNKSLKRNKLITIINKNKSISENFKIKDIKIETGLHECFVYKK